MTARVRTPFEVGYVSNSLGAEMRKRLIYAVIVGDPTATLTHDVR